MKRSSFLAPLTALAVSAGLYAPTWAIEPSNAKPQILNAPIVQVALPADAAALREAYGFAARLPKDVESFAANYRLAALWTSLAESKWASTLMSLPPVKEDRDIQKMVTQWNSPEGQQVRGLVASILGDELLIAAPAGFGDKLKPLLDAYEKLMEVYFERVFMSALSGKKMTPQETQAMLKDAAPELIPAFAKAEIPPLLIVAKAVKGKAMVDAAFAQLLAAVGKELPPAFEADSFKVDKYEFKSISLVAGKLIAAVQEEQLKTQLKELLGDEAKVKDVIAQLKTKRVELAWGWVDDHFVLSIGADHSHVKLAATEADSALSVPDVAVRAAAYAAKKPFSFSYTSKAIAEKFAMKVEFADAFSAVTEELQGILKPEAIAGMKADVKKLEAKAQSLFTPTYDAAVGVGYYEGGIRGECFGGARNPMIDSSKPLAFSGLATASTFLLSNARTSPNSKLAVDFLEEAAGTLWTWYEKYGRTMVPESERQGAAMIEATAIPLVKQAWASTRALGKALGEEAAFVIDLNGSVPKIPDLPPFLANGKIPRIAYVAELKNRPAVADSWKGFASIIKQVTALLAENAPQTIPEPQMKKDGDLEVHFVPLPIDTGDLLPHIAISKDKWILSTSPSFSKEIAAGVPGSGAPAGSTLSVSFTALWDFADQWLAVADKNAEQMFGPNDAKEFKEARPLIDTAVKLARSIQGLDVKLSDEAGKTRASVFLKLQDLK